MYNVFFSRLYLMCSSQLRVCCLVSVLILIYSLSETTLFLLVNNHGRRTQHQPYAPVPTPHQRTRSLGSESTNWEQQLRGTLVSHPDRGDRINHRRAGLFRAEIVRHENGQRIQQIQDINR